MPAATSLIKVQTTAIVYHRRRTREGYKITKIIDTIMIKSDKKNIVITHPLWSNFEIDKLSGELEFEQFEFVNILEASKISKL